MRPLRVGIVHYINSRPLAWGFLRGRADERLAASFLSPAAIADGLAEQRLEVGLVPSIELARIPGLEVVPGLAIAAQHEVRSVLLVARCEIRQIRSVAVDENSRTSAALLRLLLEERYGVVPIYAEMRPTIDEMLARHDAALVIGDPALAVDRERFRVFDLAGEWLAWTGLPFVFAVWAARRGSLPPELIAAFEESLQEGLAALDKIIAMGVEDTGLPEPEIRSYYTKNLSYRLGDAERAGLEEFLRRAALHGLAPRIPGVSFLSPSRGPKLDAADVALRGAAPAER